MTTIRPPDHHAVNEHLHGLYKGVPQSDFIPPLAAADHFVRFETADWLVDVAGDRHEYGGEPIMRYLQGTWERTTQGTTMFLELQSSTCRARVWPKGGSA